jgi:hypothetical protein
MSDDTFMIDSWMAGRISTMRKSLKPEEHNEPYNKNRKKAVKEAKSSES